MRMRVKSVLILFVLCLGAFVSAPAAAAEQPKIAVLPFEVNAGPDLSYLNENLPQLIIDRLAELDFKTASQAEVMAILEQQNLGYLDLSVAKDVALLAGANYALYGSFSQVGETLSLDVRLVEAYGLKPAKPLFVVKKGLLNILPAVEELAGKIKNELLKKEVIAEIAVTGNKILDKDVVLMRLKMQKGDVFDPGNINEDMKKIYGLGYFDDIQVKVDDLPEGKRVVFDVVEKPYIQAIGVVGADEIDEEDILAAISTKTGSVLNLKILSEDLGKIREMYRKDGFYLAKVSYEVEQNSDARARLNLVIKEGEKLYIEGITIEGAEQMDEDDLLDELALSERGIFSWITSSGVLKEELLDRDAAALEAYYANRGFFDVKVSQPKVEFKDDGIFITFQVVEGPRYKVGAVTFSGDLLDNDEVLLTVVQIDDLREEDEYFDRSILATDTRSLATHYTDYGYAFAETEEHLLRNAETLTIDVDYEMSKHQKVFIRRVVIEGNDRTRDNVIRREIRLSDGELFSGSKLRRSNVRLNKTGYFEVANVEPVPTESPNALDLKVKVKERSTGSLSGGIGYSTYSKVGLNVALSEDNLFGKGYQTVLEGTFTGKSTVYNFSFTNPRYHDSPLSVGADMYHRTDEYVDFEKSTNGGRVRFSYPIGEYTDLLWGYRLDRYDIYEVEADAATTIRDREGINWSSVLLMGANRDTTDSRLEPTTGTINKLSLFNGGGFIGGDDHYVKGLHDFNWFHSLMWDTVFRVHTQAGFIVQNSSEDTPVFERFHLGGINSIRGYSNRKISPRDDTSGDRIGGNKEFYTNLEYLFPINSDLGLKGLAFFDTGNSWDDGDWDLGDLKSGVGAGIRFYTPMGLIRLEYGYGLNDVPDQGSPHKLEFTMGTGF